MSGSRRLLLAALVLAACSTQSSEPTPAPGPPARITSLPRALSATEQGIVASTPVFGLRLLQAVNPSFADGNVFLSPLSASVALGMTMTGAAGSTFTEMRETLALPDRPIAALDSGYQALITLLRALDPRVELRLANSLWYRTSFGPAISPAWTQELRTFFGARVGALDFGAPSAVSTINTWVDSSTAGRIKTIVDEIPASMVLYLINAIHFKGSWRDGFDARRTTPQPFTTHRGTTVQVPMMLRSGNFRVAAASGRTVLELPYGGDAWALTVLLPAQGEPIDSLVARLTPAVWQSAVAGLADAPADAQIILPKFSLTWEDQLNNELQTMGMRAPFRAGGADFTRLAPTVGRELFISEVKQKTFVDVNEEGTEAAAVTSVGISRTSLPPSYRVDRPFILAIRERLSGTLLFLGKVVRPG